MVVVRDHHSCGPLVLETDGFGETTRSVMWQTIGWWWLSDLTVWRTREKWQIDWTREGETWTVQQLRRCSIVRLGLLKMIRNK